MMSPTCCVCGLPACVYIQDLKLKGWDPENWAIWEPWNDPCWYCAEHSRVPICSGLPGEMAANATYWSIAAAVMGECKLPPPGFIPGKE